MNKILYFLILITIYTPFIDAKEPTLAILRAIYSNAEQKFSIAQYSFLCKPYGVITVDELYKEAKKDSTCRSSIDIFYKQNPKDKFFTSSLLKLRQTYHIEFKNNRCILYAKGLNTLSELLLSKGLGIKKIIFQDEEFSNKFAEAQLDAKANKLGIYKYDVKLKCIAELFSIEKKNP